jgi:hypothetical protein
LKSFHPTLFIEDKRKPVLLVYTREKYYESPLHVEVEEYNRLYDTEYTTFDRLTEENQHLRGFKINIT